MSVDVFIVADAVWRRAEEAVRNGETIQTVQQWVQQQIASGAWGGQEERGIVVSILRDVLEAFPELYSRREG